MTEMHEAALRAGVFQYIQKRAGELVNAAKEELKTALPQGDVVAGRNGDKIVAKASWVKGRQAFTHARSARGSSWVTVCTFKAVEGVVIDGQGELMNAGLTDSTISVGWWAGSGDVGEAE